MASRMTTSYRPEVAHVNEEPPQKSSLNLTLTPSSLVLTHFSELSHLGNLVTNWLSDEPKNVCKFFYEIEDISIFA